MNRLMSFVKAVATLSLVFAVSAVLAGVLGGVGSKLFSIGYHVKVRRLLTTVRCVKLGE